MDNQEAIRLMRNLPTMCEFTDAYGEPIDSDAYYEAVDIAISALHAQDAPDINVGTMISRQAAIELIERMKPYHQDADDIAEMIANMPSAQPEPSTDIQNVLGYLDDVLHPLLSPDNWNVYSELHDMISRLPSAESERKECEEREQGKCPWYAG